MKVKRLIVCLFLSLVLELASGCGHFGRFLVINYTDQEVVVYLDRDKFIPVIPAKGYAYLEIFESTNGYRVSAKSKTRNWEEKILTREEVNRTKVADDVFLLEFR